MDGLLADILAVLDAEQFQRCFIAWVASVTKLGPDIVAIDGKTLRRSYQEGGAKAPIHMISAWSSRQRLVLGQAKVSDKSNEITAIPALIDLLTLKSRGFADGVFNRHQTVDGDHGRIETRTYVATGDIDWLQERHKWPGMRSIVMVESIREIGDKTEHETRFFISSLGADAKLSGETIRSHWGIENSHHWKITPTLTLLPYRATRQNRVGGGVAPAVLPHHRTYGSVSGGSCWFPLCGPQCPSPYEAPGVISRLPSATSGLGPLTRHLLKAIRRLVQLLEQVRPFADRFGYFDLC